MVDFGNGKNVFLSSKSGIGEYSIVKGSETITIEENVTMGPRVMILSSSHSFSVLDGKWTDENGSRPICIGNNCFIGGGSTILAGVSIGDYCIVAAGSVVVDDVESGSIVGGVPAKVLGKVDGFVSSKLKKSVETSPSTCS